MGINRWSGIEERKRNETDTNAGGQVPEGKKDEASPRVETYKETAENEVKR